MILITGVAGFIGCSLALKLLELGHSVFGVDNLSDYYSVELKHARLALLHQYPNFHFDKADLHDTGYVRKLISSRKWDAVIHLAAQPGVRYSLINPYSYTRNNVDVFLNILEALATLESKPKFIYASSSSVYGSNTKQPYSEDDPVNQPNSLYAATKRMNEQMAHTYHHLHGINSIGLRFFTVYGPWGRPDMAPYIFTDAILNDKPITLFQNGELSRDFTYIDDIVAGIVGSLNYITEGAELFNLGNHSPVTVSEFLNELELICGKKAIVENKPMQKGDVISTYADISKAQKAFGFHPTTDLRTGLTKFVEWYLAKPL